MQDTLSPTLIEKESLTSYSFNQPVSFKQHPDLLKKLTNATQLGNTSKVKVHIDFHTDEGPKTVDTTIWATGNQFICLKGGLWIPISRIIDIRFI